MNLISKGFHEGNMSFRDGILYVRYNADVDIDENLLFKQFMFRKQLAKEQDLFMIVDLHNEEKITKEALVHIAAHPYTENIKALAIITQKGADHMRTKLFMAFNEPKIKTKVFLCEQDAKLWFKRIGKTDYLSLTI